MEDYGDGHHVTDIIAAQQQPEDLGNLVKLLDKTIG